MRPIKSLLVLAIVLCSFSSFAQTRFSIPGTWRGTSICQVKDSPCHDEIAVYHFLGMDSVNVFRVIMNKMVNNKEEEMGTWIFAYDPKLQTLTHIDEARDARWVFTVEGKHIKGTLLVKSVLYRVINLTKED